LSTCSNAAEIGPTIIEAFCAMVVFLSCTVTYFTIGTPLETRFAGREQASGPFSKDHPDGRREIRAASDG
jgi:hypothetical protein